MTSELTILNKCFLIFQSVLGNVVLCAQITYVDLSINDYSEGSIHYVYKKQMPVADLDLREEFVHICFA